MGPILSEALTARHFLKTLGIKMAVASIGSIKPLDQEFLMNCVVEGYEYWITLEEHHRTGGLGSTLLEWKSENDLDKIKIRRIGVGDHFIHQLGSQEYVREMEGLNANAIAKVVMSL
jgi:transketolase